MAQVDPPLGRKPPVDEPHDHDRVVNDSGLKGGEPANGLPRHRSPITRPPSNRDMCPSGDVRQRLSVASAWSADTAAGTAFQHVWRVSLGRYRAGLVGGCLLALVVAVAVIWTATRPQVPDPSSLPLPAQMFVAEDGTTGRLRVGGGNLAVVAAEHPAPRPTRRQWRTSGLCEQDPLPEERESGSAVPLPFQKLDLGVGAFHRAIAVGQRQSGHDGR